MDHHQHHQHGHEVESTTKIDNSCCDTAGTQATSTGEHMMHHMMSVS